MKKALKNEYIKQNRPKIARTFVLSFVFSAVEALLCVVLCFSLVNVGYNDSFREYAARVKTLSSDFVAFFTEDMKDTESFDYTGALVGNSVFLNGKNYTAEETVKQNLQNRAVNFYTVSELCKNVSSNDFTFIDSVYVVYSSAEDDGAYSLRLKLLTGVVSAVAPSSADEILIVSDSERFIYSSHNSLQGRLGDYRLSVPREKAEPSVTPLSLGKDEYAVALTCFGDGGYYLGIVTDFTAQAKQAATLRTELIIGFSVLAVLTVAAVIFGEHVRLKKSVGAAYRVVTDADGRILRANEPFTRDFPLVFEIKDKLTRFEDGKHYVIRLGTVEEEQILSCTVKKRGNGTVTMKAERLTLPFGSDFTPSSLSDGMEAQYNAYLKHGKRVLAGKIYIGNLHNLKTLFGRSFAEEVRKTVASKICEKFPYVVDRDFYDLAVLCPDDKKFDIILQDLRDIVSYIAQPVQIRNNLVNVGLKCGFAVSDSTMESRDFNYVALAVNAALKRAKEDKIVEYYLYQEAQKRVYAKYFFKIDVEQMLKNEDFEMEYQPQYSLKEKRIVGFEALFRVKKRVELNASTFDVISYAERSGDMLILGRFIFEEGMRFAKSIEGQGVGVSLNVSPVQLMQAGFVEEFLSIYRKYDLKPGSISVEITESFLMATFDETIKKLQILHANGILIHLDDFGTAYSSLLYLKKLPISTIKIDKEFVSDIVENEYSRFITKMVVDITRELKLSNICEGVERRDQLEILRSMNNDVIIQGFLIGKSVKSDVARDLIHTFVLEDEPPMSESNEKNASATQKIDESNPVAGGVKNNAKKAIKK